MNIDEVPTHIITNMSLCIYNSISGEYMDVPFCESSRVIDIKNNINLKLESFNLCIDSKIMSDNALIIDIDQSSEMTISINNIWYIGKELESHNINISNHTNLLHIYKSQNDEIKKQIRLILGSLDHISINKYDGRLLRCLKGNTNLESLVIKNSDNLDNLNVLSTCTNLSSIVIVNCSSLRSITGIRHCSRISITGCDSLQSLDELHGSPVVELILFDCNTLFDLYGLDDNIHLEILKIYSCDSLQDISRIRTNTSLRIFYLSVDGLDDITSLNQLKCIYNW